MHFFSTLIPERRWRFALVWLSPLLLEMLATTLLTVFGGFAHADEVATATNATEEIAANDNRKMAGHRTGKTLHIELEAREGMWYPETKDGPGLPVQAFGERGGKLLAPGPQLRVPEGTRITATIRNTLEVRMLLHGFHTRPGVATDTVEIAPGELRAFSFDAGAAGTYYYWASTMPGAPYSGRPVYRDAVLSGVFIVDPRGVKPDPRERVFMLAAIRKDIALDDPKLPVRGVGQVRTYTINGLSWPYTERLTYRLGEQVRWRWINTTYEPHPLHLHGFYFDVLSLGDGERDTRFAPDMRPHVFTQRVDLGGTMALAWSPDREGNWLFHCHMLDHIGPHLRMRPAAAGHDHASMDHVRDGMTGLVLGVTVKPRKRAAIHAAAVPRRQLKLVVQEQPNRFDGAPALGYVLQDGAQEPPANTVDIPGPLLILRKDEPTSIAIINRSRVETSVHWHGMELESYFDGVPGWGGDSGRVTPPIKPGETFVAEMTPPRAGTFMYHTHWHDALQLKSGMYGPLIVLPAGQTYDPDTERVVLLSSSPPAPGVPEPLLVNGSTTPAPLQMRVGTTYRIRCINITPSHVNHFVRLASGEQPIEWRNIAKDGADLPPQQIVSTKEALSLAVGETRDFEFKPTAPGDLRVEIRLPNGNLRTSIGVQVRSATST
jgi:FtsP/CotA-like multicopper oxidase with cupredoxin domain